MTDRLLTIAEIRAMRRALHAAAAQAAVDGDDDFLALLNSVIRKLGGAP